MILNPRNRVRMLFKKEHSENIKEPLEINNMIAELKHSIESLEIQVSQSPQKQSINQRKGNTRNI